MTALKDVVGAILSDVAEARKMADEASLEIAKVYRNNPLLSGMAVPRIRVPEVNLSIPVVIKEHTTGQPGKLVDAGDLASGTRNYLDGILASNDLKPSEQNKVHFQVRLEQEIREIQAGQLDTVSVEQIAASSSNTSEMIFSELIQPELDVSPLSSQQIADLLKEYVFQNAVEKPSSPPSIEVLVETDAVKNYSGPDSVTRLELKLVEEGMEWHKDPDPDVADRLLPE